MIKTVAVNKKAFHDFEILDKIEAGLSLLGTEVKSLRDGKVNLRDGWVDVTEHSEMFLVGIHISSYTHGNIHNHEEKRPRKLLLKKAQIYRLQRQIEEKGMALIPLKLYRKGSIFKVEIGVARGKKLYDKRETSRKKDSDREMARELRHKNR